MRSIFFISAFFLASIFNAQDKMTLNSGEEIQANIVRITKSKITYKKYSNADGPEYEIDKKTVKSILFKNGDLESFENSNTLPFQVKKNVVSFNYGDFVASRFAFSYERLMNKGKLGLKIPFGVSYQNSNYYNNERLIYYTGLDVKFYPLGQKKLTYSLGIGSRVGVINDYYYYPYYNEPYYDYYYYPSYNKKRLSAGFYMNNGLTLHIIENLSISGQVGLGLRDIEGPSWAAFNAVGELNVSIRF